MLRPPTCSGVATGALLLLMVGGDVAHAQACPPASVRRDALIDLRVQRFEVADSVRQALAVALLPCLASRDPVLRDEVSASALSVWLRAKQLRASTVRRLAGETLAVLIAPRDSSGFASSFAALTLSEIVRADRLDSALAPAALGAIARAATRHMESIRDYRGFDATDGWRHDVAHSADLILQLGVHPRVAAPTVTLLLRALATQVAAHDAHVYLEAEPERMARAAVFIYARDLLPASFWESWLRQISRPEAFADWGDAMQHAAGRAQRQNTLSFLHALGFAARVARPAPLASLARLVDDELRRLVAA